MHFKTAEQKRSLKRVLNKNFLIPIESNNLNK